MATNNVTNNYSPLTTKGDLYAFSTFATRLPVGSNYYYPMADSSASLGISYQLPVVAAEVASSTRIDFLTGSLNGDGTVSAAANGTGSSCAVVSSIDNTHFGILKMDMGTTTTGYAFVVAGNSLIPTIYGNSTITIETCVYFNTLSNGTDTYTFYFGQMDQTGSIVTPNGVWIGYNSGVNSGNWTINAHASGVTTTTNASSAPTAQTWYKLKLVITNNTSAQAFVAVAGSDYVSIGTVTVTLTTVNVYLYVVEFLKSAGTTDTFGYIDFLTNKTVYGSLR